MSRELSSELYKMGNKCNEYGLSRYIPSPVKRKVRQRCGFGCVVCGSSLIEYHHLDPEFSEAKEHDPSQIALLCPQCHAREHRGFWSKDKIIRALQNPKCLQDGFASEIFDFGTEFPVVTIGDGLVFSECPVPLMVHDTPVFKIKPPEERGAPFRLGANLYNTEGEKALWIEDNEVFASTENWDLEFSGGTITIREGLGDINLRLEADPPDAIHVTRLDMRVEGWQVEGRGGEVVFSDGDTQHFCQQVHLKNICLRLTEDGLTRDWFLPGLSQ